VKAEAWVVLMVVQLWLVKETLFGFHNQPTFMFAAMVTMLMFWSMIVGFMVIDSFNRRLRRKRKPA
jgi:hypothetical protein